MCWVFERILKKRGETVQKALSSIEAMELVLKNHFQMIFLDAKLPDIDGLELAENIHAVKPQIPIVLVSGFFYSKDPSVVEAIAKGLICGFVSKPFDHNEILRIIENISCF
jgi:DNA-binding NtrC family response regulator